LSPVELDFGPLQDLRRRDALFLHGRQAAREDRLADQRHRHAQVERADAGPLAGALLAGGVEDLVDHGSPSSSLKAKMSR
jgi:hypothetical protein